MNNDICVSIICLTYNHERYIRQCIEGFLMQKTNFRFQIIIHDDHSTDNTLEIVESYSNAANNIILLSEPENVYSKYGFWGIFNIIKPHISGKYIAFCEGDDYWIEPTKLQRQVEYMEGHPSCGLCYTDFNYFIQDSSKIYQNIFSTYPDVFKPTYENVEEFVEEAGFTCPATWLYRSDLAEEIPSFETPDLTFVIFSFFLARSSVHFLPITTAVYRELPESASHSSDYIKNTSRAKGLWETQSKLIDIFDLNPEIKKKCEFGYLDNIYEIAARNGVAELLNDVPEINIFKFRVRRTISKSRCLSKLYLCYKEVRHKNKFL